MIPNARGGCSQALVDLLAGRVEMMFSPLVPVLTHLKAGRLRPIAVTERAHAEDMDVLDRTPAQFDEVRGAMIGKWQKIIKQTGIEAN